MAENEEVLIVTSKLKKYIKDKSGFNTSASTIQAVSNKVKELCEQAIKNAKSDKRKTVMDKDFL